MSQISKRRFKAINVIFTLLMGLGSMSYGYAAIVISTTLAQPSFIHYMGLDHCANASDLIGLTGSLFQVGGFIGTFFISFLADRWGRRVGIAFPAALSVVSAALLAGSVNIGMFIAFRLFAGAAACMIVSAVTLWMSELVPANVRGSFVNVNGASILLGGVMAAWVGYGFAQYQSDNLSSRQWRAPLALGVLPALILLCCLYWVPESPRWLIRNGRDDEAQRVLTRLNAPEEATYELLQIRAQIQHDETLPSSYLSLITRPSYRKRSILAVLTTISTQLTGPLVIVNYGPIIYATLGFDTNKQLIYQGGWILVGFGGGLFSLLFVDLVPRPKLIAGGILGSLAMLAVEAGLVANYATSPESLANPNKSALQAAVAAFYVSLSRFYSSCYKSASTNWNRYTSLSLSQPSKVYNLYILVKSFLHTSGPKELALASRRSVLSTLSGCRWPLRRSSILGGSFTFVSLSQGRLWHSSSGSIGQTQGKCHSKKSRPCLATRLNMLSSRRNPRKWLPCTRRMTILGRKVAYDESIPRGKCGNMDS